MSYEDFVLDADKYILFLYWNLIGRERMNFEDFVLNTHGHIDLVFQSELGAQTCVE